MIETQRLILRHWRTDDAEALYRYASDARVSELALWPRHTSVEMSRDVIEKYFLPEPSTFAVVLRSTGEPIGCIGLVTPGDEHYPPLPSEREIGYWIGRPHWCNGLMTEALDAFATYCRDTLLLDSLLLTTDERNIASQRVAEKCGFRLFARYDYEGQPSRAYRRIFQESV
ncbi:MAG: GNAT family N-acetyltransferase [Muribaculaceae bacterium]|nr:GNAT family N-acetyltransferase [Muribaculaceae bacterium]MDE6347049.1 GNAT family N-acetyltransferase [Muribaculaceae bacterium]